MSDQRKHTNSTIEKAARSPSSNLSRLPNELPRARFEISRHLTEAITGQDLARVVSTHFDYPAVPADGLHEDLVCAHLPHSTKGRALRYVAATTLLHSQPNHGLTFSLAGPTHGTGCSYVAANLAAVYSEIGLRTLLIDANTLQPSMHKLFDCSDIPSLYTFDEEDIESSIKRLSGFRSLSLIGLSKGPRNSAHPPIHTVLGSHMKTLRMRYDVVICDAPPWNRKRGSDGEAIAGVCGNVMLVLREDYTSVASMRRLVTACRDTATHIIGCVVSTH